MAEKLTCEELEQQVKELKKELEYAKQREKALKDAESYYQAFFEHGVDGVVVLDPESARLIDFNDQACRQLGYSREEFAHLRLADIEARETAEETQAHIQKILKKGFDDFDTLQRTKQGEIRHVHVSAQLIDIDVRQVYHCIWRDITERKRTEEILRFLSTRLLTSQKEEQRRIAMELHDQIGQDLIVLKLQQQALKNRLRKDQNNLKKECDKILTFTDGIIENVRRLAHGLNPTQLQTLGLCAALKAMILNFSDKTRIPIHYDVEALDQCFPLETQTILYRISQETLTNIYKHARAKKVRIDVNRQGDIISIKIKDDGQGFDFCRYRMSDPTIDRGMGLSTLALRARMIGADLKISSEPGQGTEINLIVPIHAQEAGLKDRNLLFPGASMSKR